MFESIVGWKQLQMVWGHEHNFPHATRGLCRFRGAKLMSLETLLDLQIY